MFNAINAAAFKYHVEQTNQPQSTHQQKLIVQMQARSFDPRIQKVKPGWGLLGRYYFNQTAQPLQKKVEATKAVEVVVAKPVTVEATKAAEVVAAKLVAVEVAKAIEAVDKLLNLAGIMNREIALLKQGAGKKLAEFSTDFEKGIDSLGRYSIGMHTKKVLIESLRDSSREIKNQALTSGNMFFDIKESATNPNVMTFFLPKKAGDFRSELFHVNNLGMNVESYYSFDIKFNSSPKDLIFFQVRETGRGMRKYGRDRPPLSLHMKEDGTVVAVINKINSPSKKIKLVKLPFDTDVNFSLRIVWNRDNPAIDVNLNGRYLMRYRESFGAPDSKSHYSKFGAYVPNQKNMDGIKDTKVQFDNFKQIHWEFLSAVPKAGYTHAGEYRSDNNNTDSLIKAMSALPPARDNVGLSNSEVASKQMAGHLMSAIVRNQLHQ